MFRWTGMATFVFAVAIGLYVPSAEAGIMNGDFEAPEGWDYAWSHSDNVEDSDPYPVPNGAIIHETDGGISYLSQAFTIDPGETSLRFNLRFEYEGISETEYFYAFLFQKPGFNPETTPDALLLDGHEPFYTVGSNELETVQSGVQVSSVEGWQWEWMDESEKLGHGWKDMIISIPVSSGDDFVLWFALTSTDPDIFANATLDTIELHHNVPEPTSMILGALGVGLVGVFRRRKS